MTDNLAFVDTETTGLLDVHEIWEVGLIVDNVDRVWYLPVDLGRADPVALNIGRYHARWPDDYADRPVHVRIATGGACLQHISVEEFAATFAQLTRGRHLVGAVISFDEERLRKLLRANGACPEWNYHLIDVEALAVGYLHGMNSGTRYPGVETPDLPWKSDELSRAVGVDPDPFERHTALGDARWAKAIYEAVTS